VAPSILLVEDDRRLAEMVSEYLGEAGFSVSVAGDGRTGLARLAAEPCDALVLDLMRAGRVLSRDTLMDLVKGEELEAFDRSIDVHVSRIRAAIEDDPKRPRRLLTVRGAGYVFARQQD
jgi:DNA-binding response OmpR family regulator